MPTAGESSPDVVIVGAGVAGLSCARELAAGGLRPVILERSRGVGGRCATRRVEGNPVDHGPVFLHGSHPQFLAALDAVQDARPLCPWPVARHGAGPPCQPDAFDPEQRRMAFALGINAFPKFLAQGLDIRRNTTVTHLEVEGPVVRVECQDGTGHAAPHVVLAMPLEEAHPLLQQVYAMSPELKALERLMGMLGTVPCLTVMAGYEGHAPAPEWDVSYPEDSAVLLLMCRDSAKRQHAGELCMVYQATARFSRAHQEQLAPMWTAVMLEEAARVLGPWARQPRWVQSHRWRFSRTDRGTELSAPFLVELPGGARLGVAGEVFAPGGGVQAAYLSGRMLAVRLAGRMES